MSSIYKPPQGKGTLVGGALFGLAMSVLIFVGIALSQIFTAPPKPSEEIDSISVAPPPPPPPPDEPPPPPEPEQEEPPPELDTPPPPLSLDMLDMALDASPSGAMGGDFALPSFDVNQKDLGGLEIFDLGDVDSPPTPKTQVEFKYPQAAKRKGIKGVVRVEYIVSEKGLVESINVKESPSDLLSKAVTDAIKRTRFEPASKAGKPVKVRMFASVPFN